MAQQTSLLDEKHQLTWASFQAETFPSPSMKWRRHNLNGNRFYFSKENNAICIAAGITTVIDTCFGESKFLREWKDARPNWKAELKVMAEYGTLLHIAFEQLLTTFQVSEDVIDLAGSKFNKKMQFKKDCLALSKFIVDCKVEPMFIEGILAQKYVSKNGKASYITSAIDLFCKMTIENKRKELVDDGIYKIGENKGKPKPQKEITVITEQEIYGIVDLKSNFTDKDTKVFFDSHKYQLIFGRELIKSNLGIDNVRMFNISPLCWIKEPKYILTEHIDKENYYGYTDLDILNNRINTGLIEHKLQPTGQIVVIDDKITLTTTFKTVTYAEMAEEILNEIN